MAKKKYIITICSDNKHKSMDLLPAKLRYNSSRIRQVLDLAADQGLPVLLLSGEYGLITPDTPIAYYDHLLTELEVSEMVQKALEQLKEIPISEMVFYAKDRSTAGWEAYYQVIEQVCAALGIKLQIKVLASVSQ